MLRIFAFAFFLFSMSLGAMAQEPDRLFCGQVAARDHLLAEHPELGYYIEMANQYLEEYTRNFSKNENRSGDQEIYYIPVVFHVIHNNGPENITDEQVLNGLSILNRDFRMQNSDIALVVDQFSSITADIGIEFRIATLDPQGNCTSGINRVVSDLTNEGGDAMKQLIYWPRNKYLNIWICADAQGAAGYTFMPGDVNSNWEASSDGIVIRSDYVGSIGTSSNLRSRSLTHEVGHWLNLFHTWGPTNNPGVNSNCNVDDLVDDTPNTIGYTSCSISSGSCGNDLDNVQNYMEYSYCSRMFTAGQRLRMRAALTSPIAQRNQLITQTNLNNTGAINPALCLANFSIDRTTACIGTEIAFTDLSYHAITEWTWNFGDGTIISGTDPSLVKNPAHAFAEPGVYSVTLTVSNSNGTLSDTQNNLISIIAPASIANPTSEGFEGTWPADKWFLYNPNADYTWEVTPSAFFSGTKGLKLRNFNNATVDNTDEMISTTVDMSGMDTIRISYKWSYVNKLIATDDRLRISVSGDCGENWVLKRLRKGLTNLPTGTATNSQFTPTSTLQWGEETLTMVDSALMTENFRVKFEFVGKGGNNVYLDDINIEGSNELSNAVVYMDQDFFVKIYPNPSENDINLELQSALKGKLSIQLFNGIGQLCQTIYKADSNQGNQRFIIPAQTAGVYMIIIEQDGHRMSRKVVFR